MPEQLGCVSNLVSLQGVCLFGYFNDRIGNIIEMGLGIDTPWNGEPNHLEFGIDNLTGDRVGNGKHHRTNFTSADATG